jgi:hypothetical protein
MKWLRFTMLAAAVLLCLTVAVPKSQADVGFGINIGTAPDCPYGYYPVAPYNCAPYGYYGPEWFDNGVFIGAGPWYHGHRHFYGHVDNRYDWRHYHGHYPDRGEHPDWNAHHFNNFHGNARIDEHGHRH